MLDPLLALEELANGLCVREGVPAQIVTWLAEQNLRCSEESEDTMHRYGRLGQFRDETQQVWEMPLHVKLGGGSGQDKCLRIHFCWDPLEGEVVVGHVGRRLRTGRS